MVDKLMKDDRFGRLFTDKEFQIDKGSEAYKLIKGADPNNKRAAREEDVDSVNAESDGEAEKGRDLNKLFAGKGEESS